MHAGLERRLVCDMIVLIAISRHLARLRHEERYLLLLQRASISKRLLYRCRQHWHVKVRNNQAVARAGSSLVSVWLEVHFTSLMLICRIAHGPGRVREKRGGFRYRAYGASGPRAKWGRCYSLHREQFLESNVADAVSFLP
jgi:hypothetical protein